MTYDCQLAWDISPFFHLRLRGTRIAGLRLKRYIFTLSTEHYTVNNVINHLSNLLGLESKKLFEMSLKIGVKNLHIGNLNE
jgi:hypothetical protein